MRKAHLRQAASGFLRSRANGRLCGSWLPSQMQFSHQCIVFPKEDFLLLLPPGETMCSHAWAPSSTWDGRWDPEQRSGLSALRDREEGSAELARAVPPRGNTQPGCQRGALCRLFSTFLHRPFPHDQHLTRDLSVISRGCGCGSVSLLRGHGHHGHASSHAEHAGEPPQVTVTAQNTCTVTSLRTTLHVA